VVGNSWPAPTVKHRGGLQTAQEYIVGHFTGDLRHALRQFSTARVFTITAVLTLAIGIGGTTAIFTLIHAVMLRSLPVSDPSQLYRIGDGDNCCVQGGTQDRRRPARRDDGSQLARTR
jgi:hypothetical protein